MGKKSIIGLGLSIPMVIAGGIIVFMFFSLVSPDAGEEAVLIKKPLIFGHGGVVEDSIKTGATWVAPTTKSIYVNMLPQSISEHFDDLMTSDGVPLSFDASIRFKVIDSVNIVSMFGSDFYNNNLGNQFRSFVRQAVRKYGLNETAINSTAIDQIDNEVFEKLQNYIISSQLPIELISLTVGKANPPDAIKTQRIETAAQQQRIITEQQKKLAEDQRTASELSRAKADMAYRNEMKMSTEQFIALENIKMLSDVCSKSECNFVFSDSPVTKFIK